MNVLWWHSHNLSVLFGEKTKKFWLTLVKKSKRQWGMLETEKQNLQEKARSMTKKVSKSIWEKFWFLKFYPYDSMSLLLYSKLNSPTGKTATKSKQILLDICTKFVYKAKSIRIMTGLWNEPEVAFGMYQEIQSFLLSIAWWTSTSASRT